MKILQVNKFWYRQGGADIYALELTKMLEQAGHEVARFGMAHPKNAKSKWNKYFVKQVDYSKASFNPVEAAHFIYSKEARIKIEQLLNDFKPDVVHLHNIYHQLTTSILPPLRKSGAKIVMTLHDYKLMCPNYKMYTHDHICRKCRPHKYYHSAFNKCAKDKFSGGALLSAEAYFNYWGSRYKNNIDLLIAPSKFMQKSVESWGVGIPCKYLLNAIDFVPSKEPVEKGNYLLYVGRLSEEKGLPTFFKAAHHLPNENFIVIGEGPAKPEKWPTNVKYLGYQNRENVKEYIQKAKALIMPSEWFEVNTLVIPEAHALGTWVIASNTGSIDLIKHKYNGYYFKMGSYHDLIAMIKRFNLKKPKLKPFLHITRQQHLDKILKFYQRI